MRAIILSLFFLGSTVLGADMVTPSNRVTNHVNVRSEPIGDAAIVGQLARGAQATFVNAVPRWYEVTLPNGITGFVSKAYTDIITTGPGGTVPQVDLHFLDVGTGDATIIDMGTREIVIDGGNSTRVLAEYAARTNIIDWPLELLIITHGDSDHWRGIANLLQLDTTSPRQVSEFWDPGYDRDCNGTANSARQNYLNLVGDISGLAGIVARRPLEQTRRPADQTQSVQPFSMPSLPGVTFTLLHADAAPQTTNGECSYLINNASIVVRIDVAGRRFLFTGDANGKERSGPDIPGHIEQRLLALEQQFPGTLKADLIKVPHHGSETASTSSFISAVNPEFVIISASTTHHLPKETTVDRYRNGTRIILSTDEYHEFNRDHIICTATPTALDCNYEYVINE